MDPFLAAARTRYRDANRAALEWMLDRPRLRHGLINTKLDPLTLLDYGAEDGLRGPDFIYGWIQGRALEALARHAAYWQPEDPGFARRLDAAARPIRLWLLDRFRRDGHIAFLYDRNDRPIRPGPDDFPLPQRRDPGIFGFSDIFAAKGLLAAARRQNLDETAPVARLETIAAAVEAGRFQISERTDITEKTLAAQPPDYAPRMILLGAAALLHRLGLTADFAPPLAAHILARHLDRKTGLLRDAPQGAASNPGHAIECAGFALAVLPPDDPSVSRFIDILRRSYALGRAGPGVALSIGLDDLRPDPLPRPWWPLPEAIRAAAHALKLTGAPDLLALWRDADAAFFTHFWRENPPIAYQSVGETGPVDRVPATPDLDPTYHTGLCLLEAIEIIDEIG